MTDIYDIDKGLNLIVEKLYNNLSIKKSKPHDKRKPFETVFDRIKLILKLFELTQDSTYLEEWMEYVFDVHEQNGENRQWPFSKSMPKIPNEVDTTGYALLFLGMAEKYGLNIPTEFSIKTNLKQFETQVDESGGIKTWFSLRQDNDVDPIVNTTIMWAYQISHTSNETSMSIRNYLNKCLSNINLNSQFSKYYPSVIYFIERMVKLSSYDPNFLSTESKNKIGSIITKIKPKNTLDAARFSKINYQIGFNEQEKRINRIIQTRIMKNGLWPWATFYKQNTPYFLFGSEINTSITVLEALKMERDGIKKVKY